MTICTIHTGYNEKRNISQHTSGYFHNVAGTDRLDMLRKAWHYTSGKSYSKLLHSFAFPCNNKADVVHTFNSIVVTKSQRWAVTFETTLPRENNILNVVKRFAWNRLSSENCISIIALSKSAKMRLELDLDSNLPNAPLETLRCIMRKIEILHPPQAPLINSINDKVRAMDWSGPLRLALVGHDFYRKGGLEVLIALDGLIQEGKDIILSIAGKMSAGDYASRAGEREIQMAQAIMARYPTRITCHGSIPAAEVKRILLGSHILCLPTWGDTYGYSVLEGQACGCPTITTDLRALPEINNNDCGWVIKVPKLPNQDGDLDSADKREYFRQTLVTGLTRALRAAYDDRCDLNRKAVAALQRIRKHHDPETHATRLNVIYRNDHPTIWQKSR